MAELLSPVWFDDGFADRTAVPIDAGDRGLTLGDGLFETLPVLGGRPVFLEAHLVRMMKGAEVLGIPFDRDKIEKAVSELLTRHDAIHGILRLTMTRGAGVRGLAGQPERATLLVTITRWVKGTLYSPVHLVTANARRNEHSPASRLKTLSYVDNILAAREAVSFGADDALMLNGAGHVACSTISNVMVVSGGLLKTPALGEGALPGIIRGMLKAEEAVINPIEMFDGDAVFLTNSIRLVRPVLSLDGRQLSRTGTRIVRQMFEELCAKIAADCGMDPRIADAS